MERELKVLVTLIYDELVLTRSWTTNKVAKESGLCYGTVDRLFNGETKYPRLLTIQRLGKTAGYKLAFISRSLKGVKTR